MAAFSFVSRLSSSPNRLTNSGRGMPPSAPTNFERAENLRRYSGLPRLADANPACAWQAPNPLQFPTKLRNIDARRMHHAAPTLWRPSRQAVRHDLCAGRGRAFLKSAATSSATARCTPGKPDCVPPRVSSRAALRSAQHDARLRCRARRALPDPQALLWAHALGGRFDGRFDGRFVVGRGLRKFKPPPKVRVRVRGRAWRSNATCCGTF